MNRITVRLLFFLIGLASCSVIAAPLEIELVPVGDPGNAPDPVTDHRFGVVDYAYEIGLFEITNAQYTAFLNSVASSSDPHQLYHPKMTETPEGGILRSGAEGSYHYAPKPGADDKPVNFVSIYDAARFANWLTNGQSADGTESGSYDLSGNRPQDQFTRMSAPSNCRLQYFIASENEWYKAAYYDPTLEGGAGGYWQYPTRSNRPPSRLAPYDAGNRANYGNYEKAPLAVGTYANSPSYYGTFDQEGNVAEFTDTLDRKNRIRRGSHYANYHIGSSHRDGDFLPIKSAVLGFRIVAIPVP